MANENDARYTYNTTTDRYMQLKIRAVIEGKNINKLLDEIIDKYLEGVKNE